MRSRYFYLLFIVVGFGGFLIWSYLDYAKEMTITNGPVLVSSANPVRSIASNGANPATQFSMMEKIREGTSLLKSSPLLAYETKNGKPTGDLVRRQIALAILDKNTGRIFEKRVWVKEQEVKNYRKTGVMNFEPSTTFPGKVVLGEPVASGETLDIQPKWWNSFNTFYEIENRPDLAVVANKFLWQSSYLAGLPERSKSRFTDIIYVPYSDSLRLPEIIEAGKKYISERADRAFGELDTGRIMSVSSSGHLATEGVTGEFIKSIILAEHIDPDSFNLAGDGGQELTERVLTILGANRERAYRYTGSPAGASGLAQFIESTYKAIVSKYPGARLIKDYNLGMADHVNAVKAMVLFFDNYKKEINNKITRRDVIGQIGITEEMLAAAYNGGANKVARSVNKYGLAWISSQLDLTSVKTVFKNETLNYIKKFRSVKNLNLF